MAAGKSIELEILSPLKQLYRGEVESMIGQAPDGLFGVLYNHAAMLAALEFGSFTIREAGGKERVFATSDGFFEINANKAAVLVDTAEARRDIDVPRAEEALKRAEKRLADKSKENIDTARAEAALHRAITRLKIAKNKH
jgi:F-type H+-transporting ATPase subunit epsilon